MISGGDCEILNPPRSLLWHAAVSDSLTPYYVFHLYYIVPIDTLLIFLQTL